MRSRVGCKGAGSPDIPQSLALSPKTQALQEGQGWPELPLHCLQVQTLPTRASPGLLVTGSPGRIPPARPPCRLICQSRYNLPLAPQESENTRRLNGRKSMSKFLPRVALQIQSPGAAPPNSAPSPPPPALAPRKKQFALPRDSGRILLWVPTAQLLQVCEA